MIKGYNKFIKEDNFHEYDDEVEREMNRDLNWEDEIDDMVEDEEDSEVQDNPDFDEGMEELCETLETLFENHGISVNITYDSLDISIYVFLDKKEDLKNLVRVFDVANKLKNDILPQYDSEFEIYENKEGYPIVSFDFTYSDSKDNIIRSKSPF